MAKKKTPAKHAAAKKPAAKKIKVHLPIPAADSPPPFPSDEEVVIVPVPWVPDCVEPLTETIGPVRCILTVRETFWMSTQYLVLAAAPGSFLPEALRTGQEVDVTFLPPPPAPTAQSEADDNH